jgi:hypothetical protein
MLMDSHFRELLIVLNQSTVTIHETHFLKIESEVDDDQFNEVLKRCGYIGRSPKKKDCEYFILSLNPSSWSEIPPVDLTLESWWNRHKNAQSLPEDYFIVEEQISSIESKKEPFIASARAFFDISVILRDLSEDCITSGNKAILVASSEGEFKKLNVSLSSKFDDVKTAAGGTVCFSESTRELLDLIKIDDPHQPERKNVLIRTIIDILNEPHQNSDIFWLVKNSGRIKLKYKEQYQLYVHNFSVSRLLNEIDQKSLEFNSKLMDFISTSQNKALTIPGALIAVGALIKSKGIPELFLIIFGVWAVYKIVRASNAIMHKTFDDLEWQITNSFSKYSALSEDHAVSASANENSLKLFEKISDAKERLRQVDSLAKYTLAIAIFYCSFSALSLIFDNNFFLMKNLSIFTDFVIFEVDQVLKYFYSLARSFKCG